MKRLEEDKILPFTLILIIIISLCSIVYILFFPRSEEIDNSHKIPILNKDDEQIGIFEIYENHFEGGYKTAPYLPLEMTVLILENRDNRFQLSSHYMFNSTESNFSIEFFDNNGNSQIDSEDNFIFYNYTEEVWIRVAHWGYGHYYGSEIHID
jgi:hypothetical protein